MALPIFRLVCVPAALDGVPPEWVADLLREGEVALLADHGGIAAIDAVAHAHGLNVVGVLRTEKTAAAQGQTVMNHASSLPLVWISDAFGEPARTWARQRGPMTLLVEADGPLPEDEQRRIERFVGLLGRQAE